MNVFGVLWMFALRAFMYTAVWARVAVVATVAVVTCTWCRRAMLAQTYDLYDLPELENQVVSKSRPHVFQARDGSEIDVGAAPVVHWYDAPRKRCRCPNTLHSLTWSERATLRHLCWRASGARVVVVQPRIGGAIVAVRG